MRPENATDHKDPGHRRGGPAMTDQAPRELPDWRTVCRWRAEAEDRRGTTWSMRCLDLIALLTEANCIIEQCECGAADDEDDDEA